MSEARKTMNTSDEFNITEDDRKAAEALLMASPLMTADQATAKYEAKLDELCKEFNASSYQDLMSRADTGEFSPQVCSMVLDYYSFLTRENLQ